MKRLTVNIPDNKYDIIIKSGAINDINDFIKEVYDRNKIIVITDRKVEKLYMQKLLNALKEKSFDVRVIAIECGEKNKSLNSMEKIYTKLLEADIKRKDLIIAFGGGIVGDVAGFAASTILRGVPFIQIPTTLLAMVDSSVGGKTGINMPNGKNLVGSFYQPKMVIMDPHVLKTLDKRQMANGMAELIKHAIIKDINLFNKLNAEENSVNNLFDKIEEYIYDSCKIKAEIVEKDERESNLRMTLNYGHTFGHTVEKYWNFEYNHGEAVAVRNDYGS